MASTSALNQAQQLYVGYYGRPGDPGGQEFWADKIDVEGSVTDEIVNAFGTSAEFTDVFGSLTNEEAVEMLYSNLYNRMPDAGGKAFYVGQLDAGTMSLATIVRDIINGTQGELGDGGDLDVLTNRVDAANFVTNNFVQNDNLLKSILDDVTSDPASVDAATAEWTEDASNSGTNLTIVEETAGTDTSVMRLTGDQALRIDFTDSTDQLKGADVDGDGIIQLDGVENNSPLGAFADFEAIDAYARNPLNQGDNGQNYLGNIAFDGTGWNADGTDLNGNIFLGGLGVDTASGGTGNDFMAGGGVARDRFVTEFDDNGNLVITDNVTGTSVPVAVGFDTDDNLFGGRNADFFFLELSALDPTDGDALDIDGGETADDSSAANSESLQDTDWLLLEASDDDEPVIITLGTGGTGAGAGVGGTLTTAFLEDIGGNVDDPDANDIVDIDNLENIDASGNFYGFLNGFDARLGANGQEVNGENVGIGSTAQLDITGNNSVNRIIGGFDNDVIDGSGGNDILFGGNLAYNNNPNIVNIVNNGMDTLIGGTGTDEIVFELDGGTYEGGAVQNSDEDQEDTLWLTDQLFGTSDSATMTSDGVVRLDLGAGKSGGFGNFAGYGGADQGTDTAAGFTADQTNYADGNSFAQVQDIQNVNATGLGAIDFLAAGANDPELTFNNQQNFFAADTDLDLRGTDNANEMDAEDGSRVVDNNLYASSGDDVLEGRGGNDNLMGSTGNDDFIFSLESGDDLDVIHRLTDADADNIWDTDADGNGLYGQDFGLDNDSSTGASSLILEVSEVGNPGNELANITVTEISSVIRDTDGDIAFTLDTPEIRAAVTYNELLTAVQDAIAADANIAGTLTATLNSNNTISIADAEGRTLETAAPDAIFAVTGNNVDISLSMTFGEPEVTVTEDRLLFVSYENRADNERVDDDASVGSIVSLGADAYAEDVVVSFDADGTRIAEDQQYDIMFENLAVEDVVTVDINGVKFSSQVGVDLDGTLIAGETTEAFITRFASFINDFLDDDTAAGKVAAVNGADGDANANTATLELTQVDYDGEETVFMQSPIVTIDSNESNGEPATAFVSNKSQSEVHLLDFDGRNGMLNSENVLFIGDTGSNRAALETALTAGGTLNGSDAQVVNVAQGDAITSSANEGLDLDGDGTGDAIFFNAAENLATRNGENFGVHGDDLLIGADGNDTILGGTGDDRVHGSRGTDALDGGKDLYLQDGVIRVYNAAEAAAADADPNVISIEIIGQDEVGGTIIDSGAPDFDVLGFQDTLLFQQSDFGTVGAGGAEFTITLDSDATFPNGGAGTVVVSEAGVTTGTTTFTNFENVRTVAGDGTLAGQGNDTLNVNALSNISGGVRYNLTADDATGGLVEVDNDADDYDPATEGYFDGVDGAERAFANYFSVDGVENVISGSGDDVLVIDQTEAGKNNSFSAGLGTDAVQYSFAVDINGDTLDTAADNIANPAMTLIVNGGGADVDYMDMTGALVGLDEPRDTLTSVEIIDLGDAAHNPTLDDTLDVTNVTDAVVDFVEGEVRTGTGAVQVEIINMAEFEVVNADFNDTVIVADDMINNNVAGTDSDVAFNSFLNIDLLDERDTTPTRLTVGELRAITGGTADTADTDDIPEAENIGLFTFNMGANTDTVDYSNETGLVAAVVDFTDSTDASVSNVLVSDDNDTDFADGAGTTAGGDNENRVDALTGTENVVASAGTSVVDLTNATTGLKVRFNADDGATANDTTLDRDTFRVQLSELATTSPVSGINFLEYEDAGDSGTVTQATAQWNTIHFGDNDDMVEVTDHESTRDIDVFFRGGVNEMNFNELTRSINTTISVTDFDEDNATTTGLVTATTTFTDGNGVSLGAQDNVATSYSAQNTIAAGSLRVEASQDAEDSVTFTGATDKLFILGEVIDGSDQISVTIGETGSQNTVELTGYEILQDAATDDVYDLRDLDRVLNNLTLRDNLYPGAASTDIDTIMVDNDGVAFDGGPTEHETAANEIDLEVLNDTFAFDFDILDITTVTSSGLTIRGDDDDQDDDGDLNSAVAEGEYVGDADTDGDGDSDAARDIAADKVIFGSLGLVDAVTNFDSLALTDASVTSSGSSFDLDFTDGQLQNGSDTSLFTFDGDVDELDASRVTSDLTLEVTGTAATVLGGSGDDTITGGGGDDELTGNAGDDTLSGGNATETRTIQLAGILDGTVDAGAVTLTLGTGGLTMTLNEANAPADVDATDNDLDILTGSGSDAVGAALAQLVNANIADINAVAGAFQDAATGTVDIDLLSASYDATSDLLTFTFESGVDVDDADAIVGASGDTGVSFAISAQNVVEQGSDGGSDDFNFGDNNGSDTINDFTVGDDELDFSGITDITAANETAVAAGATAALDDNGTMVFADGATASGGETVASYTDLTDVAAFLNAAATGSVDANVFVAVINDLTDTTAYAYLVDVDADATTADQIDAGDITLIGTVNADAAVTIADII
ncbi:DUF4214 domain-containing protein [Motiliproteus sp. MSK22-1]|uniref:DUF4214 domain-containing protein n=1 Tax=Motiliproteus sp. MSK22-1 TaxID=1897630 RepID=UPI0009756F18|nr:DUF4214 domain-containing protein [Motiliproteus sp. MSK22-1]OMH30399.1 hypothetical protein BGP75_18660 [Motiliproteus sp. MSK22-1]